MTQNTFQLQSKINLGLLLSFGLHSLVFSLVLIYFSLLNPIDIKLLPTNYNIKIVSSVSNKTTTDLIVNKDFAKEILNKNSVNNTATQKSLKSSATTDKQKKNINSKTTTPQTATVVNESLKNKDQLTVTENSNHSHIVEDSNNNDNTLIEDNETAQLDFDILTKKHIFSDDVENYLAKATEEPILYIENDFLNLDISDSERQALSDHLASCGYRVNIILDEDIEITLKLHVNPDASINKVLLLGYKTKSKASSVQINKIVNDVLSVFNNSNCSVLPLPLNKFTSWSNFTFKLNIKGFFNNDI